MQFWHFADEPPPELCKYARKARKKKETKATNIRNRISIHERPAEAYGKRFGDWEMDLIVDKDNHAILTMIA